MGVSSPDRTGKRRLSRQESKDLTRARLLEAATEVFAERGFGDTSVEAVCERAGYTRGAFYSNFSDKDEVVLALLEQHSRQSVREVAGLLASSFDPSGFIQSLKVRGEQQRSSKENRRWGLLSAEFWLYSLRNPKARKMLAEHRRHIRSAYASAIEEVFNSIVIDAPAPFEDLATVLMALDEGIFNQHWIDPHAVPADLFYDTLELLIAAATALHEQNEANAKRALSK